MLAARGTTQPANSNNRAAIDFPLLNLPLFIGRVIGHPERSGSYQFMKCLLPMAAINHRHLLP
jgi:hypothetical protein